MSMLLTGTIRDISDVRRGFTTMIWKKCLRKRIITSTQESMALSILTHNNRYSLDLLMENDDICWQWFVGLEYLMERYRAHLRTHHEITDRWLWQLFSRADHDHSQHLNRREIRRLLTLLNIELKDKQMNVYFNQANLRQRTNDELLHLDREEFLIFYKYVSYRPELLELICEQVVGWRCSSNETIVCCLSRFNGSTTNQRAQLLSEYSVIQTLTRALPLDPYKSSKNPLVPTLPSTSTNDDKRNYLTLEQFERFLRVEQQMATITVDDCSRLIVRFEPSIEGQQDRQLSIDGLRLLLLHDEFCLVNSIKTHRVYHDMTRPLTDYFIATSHNTYVSV
jgi:phosphatidylinositol phospholipase C, delta